MVEHRSPKPSVVGSSPACPATFKGDYMKKVIDYINLSKIELSKVIFPTKVQVRQAFFAVFLVVTVVSLFLALVDLIMSVSLSAII